MSRQVLGVALVIFHPALAPVEPARVGEVHFGAGVHQRVISPVPPTGRLEDYLGELDARDRVDESSWAVFYALGETALAGFSYLHNYRTALVQVDPYVLLAHRGLLPSGGSDSPSLHKAWVTALEAPPASSRHP
jgi:hypothetical protein